MSDTLRLALIQADLAWEDKTTNLQFFENEISKIQADIIFLPEMFTTGFSMKPEAFAETIEGDSVAWMKAQAAKSNAVITGSLIIEENGNYFNRLVWAQPNGEVITYNKRHLFSYAGEEKHYTAGTDRLIIDYKGWKIFPQVCYDLRFPVWSRNNLDYDLAFYVANWPERRSYPWTTLLKARAIENQCFLVGLNRVGDDGNGVSHSGDSMVVDPLGEPKASCTPSKVETLVTEITKEELDKVRNRFRFLADKDEFELK